MYRTLLLFCMAGILLFTSCSENSTSPVDLANGLNFTMSGELSGKFSSTTATAVSGEVDSTSSLILSGVETISGKKVQVLISVFGNSKGTYNLTLANVDDPEVMCSIIVDDTKVYGATTGTLTVTEISTTLGSKTKGTFSFTLYDEDLKEIKITAGTFNLFHISN